MSKDSGKRVRLGLFVTTALVVMIVVLYSVGKKQQLFGSSFMISGNFVDVSGLQVGNNVRLAGMNIGSVQAVTMLDARSVRVDMLIREESRPFIKRDAIASVGSESMMGNKIIVLSPGSEDAALVVDHDVLRTAVPVGIDDILKHLNQTGKNVVAITEDLEGLTGSIRSGKGALGKVFMDKQFADDMAVTMATFKESSVGFKELVLASRKSWLMWGAGKSDAEKLAEKEEKALKSRVEADKLLEEQREQAQIEAKAASLK